MPNVERHVTCADPRDTMQTSSPSARSLSAGVMPGRRGACLAVRTSPADFVRPAFQPDMVTRCLRQARKPDVLLTSVTTGQPPDAATASHCHRSHSTARSEALAYAAAAGLIPCALVLAGAAVVVVPEQVDANATGAPRQPRPAAPV